MVPSLWSVTRPRTYVMTVNGKISPQELGLSLTHEHILVDFEKGIEGKIWWDREKVKSVVLPYLEELKKHGCTSFFEFTPSYLGKDVQLLKELSDATGLHIITNTGYYGAVDNKYMPEHAYDETAEQLAARWIKDFRTGMQGTKIRPGFIKTSVNRGPMSELHQKLIKAAALTHLKTGLTIASHTGTAIPAFEEIEVLMKNGVDPAAFIWTHAQAEKDISQHVNAAKMGAWISLDGVNQKDIDTYLASLKNLQEHDCLHKVLLSHDAGWYHPVKEDGGTFRGYTAIFTDLIPKLKEAGFTNDELDRMLIENPAEAFAIRVRKVSN